MWGPSLKKLGEATEYPSSMCVKSKCQNGQALRRAAYMYMYMQCHLTKFSVCQPGLFLIDAVNNHRPCACIHVYEPRLHGQLHICVMQSTVCWC